MSYIAQEHGTILMLASISLLLLLFLYIIYRHRSTKLNEHKLHKQQQRRHSFEKNFLIPEPFEYRLPSIHPLPTIIEESPAILSPSNSSNRFTPVLSSTNSTSSPVVTGCRKKIYYFLSYLHLAKYITDLNIDHF